MTAPDPGARRVEVRQFVSGNLGLLAYPVGTVPSDQPGSHIMAATALSWLCDIAVARWGEPWATGGMIDLRFRSHLEAGLDLELIGDHDAAGVDLTVRTAAAPDEQFVTGRAEAMGNRPFAMPAGDGPSALVALDPAALDGLVLRPIELTFEAERDLRMADHLPGGSFWLDRGWAHPGWFASVANAAAAMSIAFDPPTWMYAGVRVDMHAPVTDGPLVTGGRVVDLFQSRRYRFAVCELSVQRDGEPVVSMRTTFVYGANPSAT